MNTASPQAPSSIDLPCGCRLGWRQRMCAEARELQQAVGRAYRSTLDRPRGHYTHVSYAQARTALSAHLDPEKSCPPPDSDPMRGEGTEMPRSLQSTPAT